MQLVKTEDAVGMVLCHDITQIIKGVTKDAVFRKGHIIQPEDIPVLLSVGKDNIYVWDYDMGNFQPYVIIDQLYEEFQRYRELGVRGLYWMRHWARFGTELIEIAMAEELMWNPDMTREEALEVTQIHSVMGLLTPESPLAQYCICSTIADSTGTIYYKNDSCYMMAITSKILSIEVRENPEKMSYKVGETFDASGPAYAFSPEKEDPVLRIDTSKTTLTISRGTDITFDSARGGTSEGSVDSTGVTVSGDTYADVELSSRMIRDLGGSIAMLAEDIPVRVSYRSNDNTTLLPSSAVRGAGDDRYVYTVQQTQSAFGVNSLVTQKQSVTVLAEAEGTVSVAEDLSYMQIAYMEDREIGENTTVMEYVN